MVAVTVALFATTVTPTSGHGTPAAAASVVKFPSLPVGSMVVLLDPSPMSFLAVFAGPDIRFVGANNRIIGPDRPSRLRDQVEAAIKGQPAGLLWGVENTGENPGEADKALAFYHLRRGGDCSKIETNLQRYAPISLCSLLHTVD